MEILGVNNDRPMTKDDFYIEILLIDPVDKIIKALEAGLYCDNDIPWLDKQLQKYSGIACKIVDAKITPPDETGFCRLNEHTTSKYLEYFNLLLSLFKTV